jgi:hypothetical protein
MSPANQRALFLLGGIAVGGLLVMATMRLASPEPKVVYRQMPNSSSTSSTPTTSKVPAGAPNGPPTTPSGDIKFDPSKQPYNPFAADLGSPMPSKEITGHIEPGPMVSNPKTGDPKSPPVTSAPPETSTPKGLLVTMRLDVSDPNTAVKALQSIASKVGGSAIQFDESAVKPDPEGALVFVSIDKYEEASKLIETVGAIVVSDRWTGSALDRIDRIERTAGDRLSDLRIQRQELIIKFFDDAPQVKHVDEDAERISKCVAALRAKKPGPNTAVIKIKFLT